MKIQFLLIVLFFTSCIDQDAKRDLLAVNKDGLIHNYGIDDTKPKVISHYPGVSDFELMFSIGFSNEKILEAKVNYPEFEFVFYVYLEDSTQINDILRITNQYQISVPIYLDINDSHRADGMTCSVITGADNKQYGVAVLGTEYSPFDKVMQQAIEQIKKDNNGIK